MDPNSGSYGKGSATFAGIPGTFGSGGKDISPSACTAGYQGRSRSPDRNRGRSRNRNRSSDRRRNRNRSRTRSRTSSRTRSRTRSRSSSNNRVRNSQPWAQ
jgi:hypothetical protein